MLTFVKGDLFSSDADIIAHGVNCRGAFGSGIAGIVAKLYPRARRLYIHKYKAKGWKLGDVQFVAQNDGKCIANCATQLDFGYMKVCNANYPAIRACMESVKDFAKGKKATIALPKIGAGLAGGDWSIIKVILEEVFSDYDATVYYLDTP